MKAAALGLLEMTKESGDMEAYHYAALLTQPQWKFHKTNDPAVTAVVVNDEICIHRRLPLSLTFDHRCITGGEAARFLAALIAHLQD